MGHAAPSYPSQRNLPQQTHTGRYSSRVESFFGLGASERAILVASFGVCVKIRRPKVPFPIYSTERTRDPTTVFVMDSVGAEEQTTGLHQYKRVSLYHRGIRRYAVIASPRPPSAVLYSAPALLAIQTVQKQQRNTVFTNSRQHSGIILQP